MSFSNSAESARKIELKAFCEYALGQDSLEERRNTFEELRISTLIGDFEDLAEVMKVFPPEELYSVLEDLNKEGILLKLVENVEDTKNKEIDKMLDSKTSAEKIYLLFSLLDPESESKLFAYNIVSLDFLKVVVDKMDADTLLSADNKADLQAELLLKILLVQLNEYEKKLTDPEEGPKRNKLTELRNILTSKKIDTSSEAPPPFVQRLTSFRDAFNESGKSTFESRWEKFVNKILTFVDEYILKEKRSSAREHHEFTKSVASTIGLYKPAEKAAPAENDKKQEKPKP